MKVYLVDPLKRLRAHIITRQQYRHYLKTGYRVPTVAERMKYLKEERENEKSLIDRLKAKFGDDFLDVQFISTFKHADGYGEGAMKFREIAVDHGVFLNKEYNGQRIGLVYHQPYQLMNLKTDIKILYTMFESDKMPDMWRIYLPQADLVLTPSQFCADVMKKQFDVDAVVLPLGFNTDIFKPQPKQENEQCTFLHYDAFNWRKGWDLIFKAFNNEFKPDEPVKLIFKTKFEIQIPFTQYPNIEIIKGNIPHQMLTHIISNADCFVFPSRGEGFGLTPLEAMGCGVPVIAPNAHGIAQYFDDKYMMNVAYTNEPAIYGNFEYKGQDMGNFIKPDIKDLQKQMRMMFQLWKTKQLQDCYPPSKVASWAKDNYSIYKTTKGLCDHIRRMNKKKPKKKSKLNIHVGYIVLNEGKYIEASLKSVMKRPEVRSINIVEGADIKFPLKTDRGLSIDDTTNKIKRLIHQDERITYHQHGLANNKEELRQRCLDMAYTYNIRPDEWFLFVDGDEVWSDDDWAKMIETIKENSDKGAILFKHYHFWKTHDQITTGGQWDAKLPRLFRLAEKNMLIGFHGGFPICVNGMPTPINEKYQFVDVDTFGVHHYGACKSGDDIRAKLKYYEKRDTKLEVKDTWTNWKKGDETQWTHGNGIVKKYKGKHPHEVHNI